MHACKNFRIASIIMWGLLMRRYYEIVIILSTAFLFAITSSDLSLAATEKSEEVTWTSWPFTVYYLARLSGPDAPYDTITVNITAVDEYKLYVNGAIIGTDSDWQTLDSYPVNISGNDVVICVEVTNYGIGNGNGLMVDIQAGSDWLGTTTLKRHSEIVEDTRRVYPVKWYYYVGNITDVLGEDWYTLQYNPDGRQTVLDDAHITGQLKEVMLGTMGEVNYYPDPHIEVIAGYPGNIYPGSSENGGIQLRSIEGENIAFNKPSEEEKLNDGDLNSGYEYRQDPLGATAWIDLERIYRVNRMIIYTGGPNPNDWERKSLRGYAVDVSLDKFRWEEVGVIHEIGVLNKDQGSFDYGIVDFPDEWARYVRYRITESRQEFPNVGEVMIYGVGHVYEGEYESPWIDFGTPDTFKNVGTVIWEGEVPEGTRITFQTKSATMLSDGTMIESPWSDEYSSELFNFESSGPVVKIKYRVNLNTQDIYRTPVMKSIMISYSEAPSRVADLMPKTFFLNQNYPNPFNATTNISFSIPYDRLITLVICDILGGKVRILVSDILPAGLHTFIWDGKDNDGEEVSSGFYTYYLKTDSQVVSKRMLLLK